METKRLIPYSLYLPVEQHEKLKSLAKSRKAAALVRDAIDMILSGNEAFNSGYNKAIKDVAKIVYDCPEAQMVAIKGKDLGSILTEQIEALEMR